MGKAKPQRLPDAAFRRTLTSDAKAQAQLSPLAHSGVTDASYACEKGYVSLFIFVTRFDCGISDSMHTLSKTSMLLEFFCEGTVTSRILGSPAAS